jgi:Spy/CpxP family protein refolding chaperone
MNSARGQIDSLLTPEQRARLEDLRHQRAHEARR